MTRNACGPSAALLLFALAVPALGQNYFLYTPKPAAVEEKKQVKDSILVREVTVQKGDTLSALSRTYSGRASYYPQILLFNDIRNPHLIHTGDIIKVPVTRDETAEPAKKTAVSAPKKASSAPRKQDAAMPANQPVSELSLSDLKQSGTSKKNKQVRRERKKASVREAKMQNTSAPTQTTAQASTKSAAGKNLYEQAHAAYQQGDCTTALPMFDRFLSDNPTSPQAADVSLYKADCYLKLSK